MAVEIGIAAANPFEHHGGVLFLFFLVMQQRAAQRLILANVGALAVPVNGFQFFHQRMEGARHVARLRLQYLIRCVPCDSHVIPAS